MEGIHQLVGNLSHYLQGRWCRISSSNSSHQIGRDFSSSQRTVSDVSEVWTDFVCNFLRTMMLRTCRTAVGVGVKRSEDTKRNV